MLDLIIADYYRIVKRLTRVIWIALFYLIMVIIVLAKASSAGASWNSVNFFAATDGAVGFISILIGLIDLLAVFTDDFKAKNMQVAIGLGVSRARVIAAKLIEAALLLLTDVLLMALLLFILAPATGAPLAAQQAHSLCVQLFSVLLGNVAYISLVMPIVFYAQGLIVGILVFLPLAAQLPKYLLRMLSMTGPEWLQRLHLETYTLDGCLELFRTYLVMNRVNLGAVAGIIVYMALGYILALLIFRRQELEF